MDIEHELYQIQAPLTFYLKLRKESIRAFGISVMVMSDGRQYLSYPHLRVVISFAAFASCYGPVLVPECR